MSPRKYIKILKRITFLEQRNHFFFVFTVFFILNKGFPCKTMQRHDDFYTCVLSPDTLALGFSVIFIFHIKIIS